MRESKKRKVVEVEAPPAKRRRAAHGAVAGLTKQRAMEQRQWAAKFAELELYHASHGDCNVPRLFAKNDSQAQQSDEESNIVRPACLMMGI